MRSDSNFLTEFLAKTRELFPDSERKANTIFSSGDRVNSEWTLTATQTEPFLGVRLKVPICVQGISVVEIKNGKINQWSDYYDQLKSVSSGRRTTGSRSVTWISFLALERHGPATDDHVGPSRWRPAVDDWQVHAWRACERRACRPDCRWLGLPVFRSAPSGGRAPQRPRCGAGRGELVAPRPASAHAGGTNLYSIRLALASFVHVARSTDGRRLRCDCRAVSQPVHRVLPIYSDT